MSETTASPKRRYQRIRPEDLDYAKRRFAEHASTGAVRAELDDRTGIKYPYNVLHYHWKLAAEARKALHAAGDAQDGGE